jgi:hypothetical protein
MPDNAYLYKSSNRHRVRVLVPEEDESTTRQLLNQHEPLVSEPTTLNGFQLWLLRVLGGGI